MLTKVRDILTDAVLSPSKLVSGYDSEIKSTSI
jgi:hypothetical protein